MKTEVQIFVVRCTGAVRVKPGRSGEIELRASRLSSPAARVKPHFRRAAARAKRLCGALRDATRVKPGRNREAHQKAGFSKQHERKAARVKPNHLPPSGNEKRELRASIEKRATRPKPSRPHFFVPVVIRNSRSLLRSPCSLLAAHGSLLLTAHRPSQVQCRRRGRT